MLKGNLTRSRSTAPTRGEAVYKLTDYVVEVHITGLDLIYGDDYSVLGRGPGSMLITYNNGPQSRFALKPSGASRLQIRNAVLFCARGQVLDAIEAVQRFKDGEPEWLRAAKQEAVKSQEAKEQRARILAWQAANPL